MVCCLLKNYYLPSQLQSLESDGPNVDSLFQLTLIYAEKFEFENPIIMEDKQCEQTGILSND